jgi:predicted anti-sigma-YlaC factor YlaD
MSCRDTIHLICWYLEGRLSPAIQTEIENHLMQCGDCRMVQEAATTTLDRDFGSSGAARRIQLPTTTQAA